MSVQAESAVIGQLYGLGIGPGDPELITVKAFRLMKETPVIAYPKKRMGEKSYALTIAETYINPGEKEMLGLVFRAEPRLSDVDGGEKMNTLEAKVYIVGAGPGDPDLITVKGARILSQADVILYTDSLVNADLIAGARPDAWILKSAGMALEEMVEQMASHVGQGKSVARIHTGDPAVYGAIFEQIVQLKNHSIPYEIVPGVSSVFAAAAVLGVELTVSELTQTVILTRAEGRTPVPEREKLRDLASHHATLALFLSAALDKKVIRELLDACWSEETPVAVVQRATWPDERIVRTTLRCLDDDLRRAGIRSHAMILAGWALDEKLVERGQAYRSKLYDKTFTHGYRRGADLS